MKNTLRDYQIAMADEAVFHLTEKDKPFILVAATGAGKSLVIAEIAQRLDDHVLVLQPTKELLEQNYGKFTSYDTGIESAIYSASMKSKKIAQVTYATIGSIYKKPELFKHFKYVIVDECHLVDPKSLGGMYMKFFTAIGCTNVCGLTATPYRMCQKYFTDELGEMFYTSHLKMINRIYPFFWKSIVYKVETQDLIDRGFLCPVKYRSEEIDYSQLEVNSTGANFTEESVERFWNDQRLEKLAKTIQFIDQHCKRNLVFCSSMRQARKAQEMLSIMGIHALLVSAETPADEREEAVKLFKSGKMRHMINVGVFTTGFDVPELDSVVLARNTMSLALYYQMVGRGIRIDPNDKNKVLRVFDLVGCLQRFGRVETIRIVKEEVDVWKDVAVSEVGEMTEVPLFTYHVKKKVFKRKNINK